MSEPELQPIAEDLREIEIDQFQRYVAVAGILDALHTGAGVASVLDVGSGPNATLQRFLRPERFTVRRADVQDFANGDAGFVRLVQGEPIAAADGAFDFVTALDVLEHVPPDGRAAWLTEVVRVARVGTIVTAPNGHPEVARCEALIDAAFARQNGTPHPFLVEHFGYGLPSEASVHAAWSATGRRLATYAVHPLHEWVASLMLMQRLLTVDGGQDACTTLDRLQNRGVRFWPRTVLCYRKIHVAVADDAAAARLPAGALGPGSDAPECAADPLEQLARYAAENSRAAHAELAATREREQYWRTEALANHDKLGQALVELERARAERDAIRGHADRVEAALRETDSRRHAHEVHIAALRDDLVALAAVLGAPTTDRETLCRVAAELQHRLAAELRDGARRYLRLRPRQLDDRDRALLARFPPDERAAT